MWFHLTAQRVKWWFASAGSGLAVSPCPGSSPPVTTGAVQLATVVQNQGIFRLPSHCICLETNRGKRVRATAPVGAALVWGLALHPKERVGYSFANPRARRRAPAKGFAEG